MMNVELTPVGWTILTSLVIMAAFVAYNLYRKHLFWKFIEQDDDIGHPLKLLRLYRAQNTEG